MKRWTTDAEAIAVITAFCTQYPELESTRCDPKAFCNAAAALPPPEGVSLAAVARTFALSKKYGGLTR